MKKLNINWNNVDWNKRTTEIADELGVTPGVVSYHRNGMDKRAEKRSKYYVDWSNVDWTKPNFVIADEKVASPGAVIAARKRYAPDHLKVGRDIDGAHGKAHRRDSFKGKRMKKHQPTTPPADHFMSREEQHRDAQRRAVIIFTADAIANAYLQQVKDQERLRNDHRNALTNQVTAAPAATRVTIGRPVEPQAQPSWVKRKLIALRDWLFNLCVSVEKEANK